MSSKELEYLNRRIEELRNELKILEALRNALTGQRSQAKSQDVEGLDNLPWKQYKDGRGEWIFENEAPQSLLEKLSKGRAVINGYVYDFSSGRNGKRFVRRRPHRR